MSDAIGGGGGGGGGSDPFGMLQQILDPLGLFKGIGGGIDKLLKGDNAEAVAKLSQTVTNNVGQYSQTGALGPDSYQDDPTKTELHGSGGEPEGYGDALGADASHEAQKAADLKRQYVQQQKNRAGSSSAMTAAQQGSGPAAAEEGRASSSSSMTGTQAQQGDPRASGASAMIATVDPYAVTRDVSVSEMTPEEKAIARKHLAAIAANFALLDEQGMMPRDHKFDAGNLANIVGSADAPAELKEAAHYLLTHRQLLTDLKNASGGGTGLITDGAVAAFVTNLTTGGSTNANPGQTGAPSPGQSNTGGGTPTGGSNVGGGAPEGNMGIHTVPTKAPKPYPQPKTLDECLANIKASLEHKQQELIDASERGDSPETIAMAEKELTDMKNRFQQMYELVGNLHKAFHEMSMASIRHIN